MKRFSALVILTGCGIIQPGERMPDRIQVLAQYLADTEKVLLAYLFGSQATGTAGPQSNYDIALLVRNPSLDLQAHLAHEIGTVLGTDLVD